MEIIIKPDQICRNLLLKGNMVLPSDLPFYSKEEKVEYTLAPQV